MNINRFITSGFCVLVENFESDEITEKTGLLSYVVGVLGCSMDDINIQVYSHYLVFINLHLDIKPNFMLLFRIKLLKVT